MDARGSTAFILLIAAQAAHSVEEYLFRLYDVLAPARAVAEAFGVARPLGFAIANALLVGFGWWCWYARVRPAHRSGRAFAWFWALLEIANGLGHMALAVFAGGYFPELATAPLLFVIGAWLAFHLTRSAAA